MGFLDSLLGGGSETTTAEIPRYIERPSEFIANRVGTIMGQPGQRQFNPFQQQGVNQLVETARAGNPFLGQSTQFLQDLYGTSGMGEGEFGLANALVGGQAVNPAAQETARIAFGGELGQNPFLESQFNRAANVAGENFRENVIPGMDTEYAQAGRSGGMRYAGERNRAEDAYGRQINDLANQVYGGQYNTDLARRDQALQQLGGLGQQDVANRLAGAGLYQQGRQNVFAGLGQAAGIDAMRYADPTRLFEAGNLIQNQPWGTLQQGANLLSSLQYPRSQTTQANPNPFAQLVNLGTQVAHSVVPFTNPQQPAGQPTGVSQMRSPYG